MNLPWVQQMGAVLPWRRTALFLRPYCMEYRLDVLLPLSRYLTVMRGIVRVPITGVVAAFTALDADELTGAGEGGEAQLRQSIRQLGSE